MRQFADRHGLRVRNSPEGKVIPGRVGHISDNADGMLVVVFLGPPLDSSLDNTLRSRCRMAIRAGFDLCQQGDFESILAFDPADDKQARLAIDLVQARRRRKVKSNPRSLENLRRDPTQKPRPGLGATIEAEVEGTAGPVAEALIQAPKSGSESRAIGPEEGLGP